MKVKKIFSLFLAKDLLRLGHKIIGIEYNKPQNKEIYIFEVTDNFMDDFKRLSDRFKQQQ